jgi:hypothetical protein
MVTLADTAPARRGQMTRLTPTKPELPEPTALFDLVVRTFRRHEPVTDGGPCDACAAPWPCEPARHAWRLREGF